jgi:hypothetical protein
LRIDWPSKEVQYRVNYELPKRFFNKPVIGHICCDYLLKDGSFLPLLKFLSVKNTAKTAISQAIERETKHLYLSNQIANHSSSSLTAYGSVKRSPIHAKKFLLRRSLQNPNSWSDLYLHDCASSILSQTAPCKLEWGNLR